MKEKSLIVKDNKILNIVLLAVVFIFFFGVTLFIPLCGDDFGNYQEGTTVKQAVEIAYKNYFVFEGRFISRILIVLLTSRRVLNALVIATSITSIIYFASKFIKSRHSILVLSLLTVFILNINGVMYKQVYFWIAGSSTYLLEIPLMLAYFVYMDKLFSEKIKHKKAISIFFVITNFITTMFVENMALTICFVNLFYVVYSKIKYKKIDKLALACLIASTLGASLMIFSPGVRGRVDMSSDFNKLSLVEKINITFPNFIYFTFTCNAITLLFGTIYVVKFINQIQVKNKIVKFITKIINLIIVCMNGLNIINIAKWMFPFSLKTPTYFEGVLHKFVYVQAPLYKTWFILFILTLVGIVIYKAIKKGEYSQLLLTLAAFGSTFVMITLEPWGERVSFLANLLFIIVFLRDLDLDKFTNKSVKYFTIFLSIVIAIDMLIYTNVYYSVYRHTEKRELTINQCVESGANDVIVKKYPEMLLWNSDKYFSIENFKKIYKFKENQEIKQVDEHFEMRSIFNDLLEKYIN